ncbi:MAG: transposase [Ignavibacterium album]|uniref:transposase n=1 Tax=Ignavibacterium album TaxID=591197 RepID=UPI0026E9FD73|nr:transposase [Ignavibacterium album]MBI5660656.1 transposase [Ignavibacterium album]
MKEENSKYANRKRNRLKEYDYSNNGYYFITICVHNHLSCFGDVEDSRIVLNDYGKLVKDNLINLNKRFESCELDYFIIMPNHIHIIFIIDNTSNKKNSLPDIIKAFKSITTIELHRRGLKNFKWQRSYYDRIIRNEKELYYIRQYIEQNPLRWELEKDNPENIDLF